MTDVRLLQLGAKQFNRVSLAQLASLGLTEAAVAHRVKRGRLIRVHDGVYALAPVLDDEEWAARMAATLTAPDTHLSRTSAAVARGWWSRSETLTTVTRPGSGGPRRFGELMVFYSATLAGDCTALRGVPITSAERTLLDIAGFATERALARAVRESLRMGDTTATGLGDALGRYRGRRGCARLALALSRYAGLPIERARSGAEVRALEIVGAHGRPMPMRNQRIAGEEADLSWREHRLIVEIDGGPFHLDAGEDARKQSCWEGAGWTVRRLPADDVYERPARLLAVTPR